MNIRKFLLLLTLFSTVVFSACQRSEPKTEASVDAKRYELTGKVVSVDRNAKKAKIEHDAIEGYMPAMTMDFPIKEDWAVRELKANDKITATMVVEPDGTFYLDKPFGIMSAGRDESSSAISESGQKLVGVEVPNFQLVNQDNKRIGIQDFRGKNLAVTFIFTRCPDADMCPYMSISFSDLAKQIEKSPDLANKTRLLTVTFDPQYDSPKVLREYGAAYFGKDVKPNFELWQLATGTEAEIKNMTGFFGVMTQKGDGTNIIHNLRTILINPEGKIFKVYTGNTWKKEDLLRDLEAVSDVKLAQGIGIVTKINLEIGSVELNHEEIKGLMPAMIMEFYVADKKELEQLKVGDKTRFTLEDNKGAERITQISKIE